MSLLRCARSIAANLKGLPAPAFLQSTRLMGTAGPVDDDDSYVYLPPGSSMKEPFTISGGSQRVYFTDPIPDVEEPEEGVKPAATTVPPAADGKADADKPGHPYKMVDEYAQQTYVYSAASHSMREPRYLSVKEPTYMAELDGEDKPKK